MACIFIPLCQKSLNLHYVFELSDLILRTEALTPWQTKHWDLKNELVNSDNICNECVERQNYYIKAFCIKKVKDQVQLQL